VRLCACRAAASIAGNVYMNTGGRRPLAVKPAAEGEDGGEGAPDVKPVPPVSSYRNVS
jgi:hypothetical protein